MTRFSRPIWRFSPHLFKSADEISPALRAHLRYPIDLFDIQATLYNTYHMTTPIVFYNREDVWEIPTEYYGTVDRPIRMRPYYVMARLPDEDREEYILMLPATPSNKPNMIGWIFARCDGENYGRLVVYKLPKETLIYGPMLIEQRINQDTDISREITLWDQRGSDVIRGNLLVIPIPQFVHLCRAALSARIPTRHARAQARARHSRRPPRYGRRSQRCAQQGFCQNNGHTSSEYGRFAGRPQSTCPAGLSAI